MNDAKKSLQKTVGLGHKPNVVPAGPASINSEPRVVEIGWHPVAGGAGKWFADSIIGSKIQERTKNYPGLVYVLQYIARSGANIMNQIQHNIGLFWLETSSISYGKSLPFICFSIVSQYRLFHHRSAQGLTRVQSGVRMVRSAGSFLFIP